MSIADTFIELSICADCLIWQANGDDSGFSDAPDQQAHNTAVRKAPALVVGDHDHGFCRTSCDACGETLHGDRYQAFRDTRFDVQS